jgi:hypothetical protein
MAEIELILMILQYTHLLIFQKNFLKQFVIRRMRRGLLLILCYFGSAFSSLIVLKKNI